MLIFMEFKFYRFSFLLVFFLYVRGMNIVGYDEEKRYVQFLNLNDFNFIRKQKIRNNEMNFVILSEVLSRNI